MRCSHFYHWVVKDKVTGKPRRTIEIPCGKCVACRVNRAQGWAMRLCHELTTWKGCACFLTLTYDDDSLPEGGFLVKRDLQLFFKRLRKLYKVKYYACGEYGETYFRPHYHVILFGLDFADFDLDVKGWIVSHPLKDCWGKGGVHAGYVSVDSCLYVAGYIDKVHDDRLDERLYVSKDLPLPFQVCSKGIGMSFAFSDRVRMCRDLCTMFSGHDVKLPRYYVKVLGISERDIVAAQEESKRERDVMLSKGGLLTWSETIMADYVSRWNDEKRKRGYLKLKSALSSIY